MTVWPFAWWKSKFGQTDWTIFRFCMKSYSPCLVRLACTASLLGLRYTELPSSRNPRKSLFWGPDMQCNVSTFFLQSEMENYFQLLC